ncbi:hypothetical protein KIH74_07000 [Kineosporia sp. J2-2]|uniref:Uncharacterized protein n=1 Tax=Kineosporia corallincola TaxID=2835133 RepID=A0ABS5TCU4_9ACTN|nr:hypothetical protein [Kineosporia corallincola]MBT0768668.1 hypothetical protein [Kineosporia corallincola]
MTLPATRSWIRDLAEQIQPCLLLRNRFNNGPNGLRNAWIDSKNGEGARG